MIAEFFLIVWLKNEPVRFARMPSGRHCVEEVLYALKEEESSASCARISDEDIRVDSWRAERLDRNIMRIKR